MLCLCPSCIYIKQIKTNRRLCQKYSYSSNFDILMKMEKQNKYCKNVELTLLHRYTQNQSRAMFATIWYFQ